MAKNKKDIDAFQKAMLTNTKVIGKKTKSGTTSGPVQTSSKAKTAQAGTIKTKNTPVGQVASGLVIDQGLYKEYETISAKYGINVKEFIDVSLRMVLELEEYWFNEDKQ